MKERWMRPTWAERENFAPYAFVARLECGCTVSGETLDPEMVDELPAPCLNFEHNIAVIALVSTKPETDKFGRT